MRVTFVVPSSDQPKGGVLALYEFANALSRRDHEVHVVHVPWLVNRVRGMDDLDWFEFEGPIQHHFVEGLDDPGMPDADFVSYSDEHIPERCGLPFVFVQGYGFLPREMEDRVYLQPCPKVCVGSWLVDIGRRLGVPPQQLAHIPNGVDHRVHRIVRPIEDRPTQVSMLYGSFYMKGSHFGLTALEEVTRRVPDVRVVAFGAEEPVHKMPPFVEYHRLPERGVIVDDIYNPSRVFLCSSNTEGFGLTNVEAMACGCALVTTDNGGSSDYAIDGETALVCEPQDAAGMAERVVRLLQDDDERVALARRGHEYVQRFDWDESGRLLEELLVRYAADPAAHRQPVTRVSS